MTRSPQELAQTVRGFIYGPSIPDGHDDITETNRALKDLVALAEAGERPVFAEIDAERARQDAKCGGPDHDDIHSWHHWIDFIIEHAGKAYSTDNNDESYANARRRYIEVAALAVAAVESMDRTVMPSAALGEGS